MVRESVLVAVAGCAFHPGAVPPASDGTLAMLDGASDGPAATPFCDPTDATLVACYAFEDVLLDGSPRHNDPNIAINASYRAGKVGQALVVGPTTEVDVRDSPSFKVAALTIEGWIDPTQLPVAANRAGVLDCQGQYGLFLHPNGELWCSGGTVLVAPANITANTWTHVACTIDGTMIRIYIDGILSMMGPTGPLSTAGTTGITLGGNNPPGGGDPLNGALDQLRLFSTVRSPAQICADAGRPSC